MSLAEGDTLKNSTEGIWKKGVYIITSGKSSVMCKELYLQH